MRRDNRRARLSMPFHKKHLQVLTECVIEAGDLDLVQKKKLTVVSFVESIPDIFKGFRTYDDRQDITSHQCSVDLIKLYSDHIAVHINTSKENLLEEYQKKDEIEEMPTTRITFPQATATLAVSLIALPSTYENYGQRAQRLLNERAAATASSDNTPMDVAAEPAQIEQPRRPDTNIDAVLNFKLKTTLEVIFVSGWGEFITQYQFNKLNDRMSMLEKGQTVTKTAEETAVALDKYMSMDDKLIGNYIIQQVSVTMAEKSW